MLETLREFALEQLVTQGELDVVRHRHAHVYEMFAAQWVAGKSAQSQDTPSAIRWARDELDNLRTAMRWAIERQEVLVAEPIYACLVQYLMFYGRFEELARLNEQILALEGIAENRVTALACSKSSYRARAMG